MKGEKVYLRTLEPEDIDFVIECENNPENWRISQTLVPFSRNTLTKFVNSEQDIFFFKQVRFVICLNNGTPAGTLDLFEYDPVNARAGVGILICKDYRGNGYGSDALNVCIHYAFEHLLLESLFCNILAGNSVSLSLFRTAGFQEAGVKKRWVRTPDGWEDEVLLQLLKDGKKE